MSKKSSKPQTFVPAVSFTGYPDDIKTHFDAGVESASMPAEFIDLVRSKGFIRDDEPVEGKTDPNDSEQTTVVEAGQPEG